MTKSAVRLNEESVSSVKAFLLRGMSEAEVSKLTGATKSQVRAVAGQLAAAKKIQEAEKTRKGQ